MADASILIVDDQEQNLVALEAILTGHADRIVQARSGSEALRRLLEEDFAVILLDVQMPEMDGFEAAELIRKRERSQNTPIIFVTAFSRTDENVQKGYALGAVDYLFKPIVPEILKSKVSIFVELWRNRHELQLQSEELARANTRLELVLDSVDDGIAGVSPDGSVAFANRAALELLELEKEKLPALSVEKMLHSSLCDGLDDCELKKALVDLQNLGFVEHELRTSSGRRFPGEVMVTPLSDSSKGSVVVFRDISERKAAEEAKEKERKLLEAESANRAKDEFLAILSHELRTPMTAILGWSRMIMAGDLDETNFKFAVESIHNSASLQSQLIEDILDVSRIVTGKLFVDSVPFDLTEVAQRALDTIQHRAEESGVHLEASMPELSSVIVGDPARMQQVLWNLLANAVKFTPRGGRVELKISEPSEGQVTIQVIDTGQGIEPNILPSVFDRFQQGEDASTRSHGGLGLGLGIVRYIAEAHDGSVSASSEGPGKGSIFTVELPVSAETFEQSAVSNGADDTEILELVRGKKFLVVDDDSSIRKLVAMLIERHQGKVELADSVDDALQTIANYEIDLVICDIAMPGKDGFDLLHELRSGETRSEIPVIAFTAFAAREDQERILEAGFSSHLSKPIRTGQLLDAIREALDESRAR